MTTTTTPRLLSAIFASLMTLAMLVSIDQLATSEPSGPAMAAAASQARSS